MPLIGNSEVIKQSHIFLILTQLLSFEDHCFANFAGNALLYSANKNDVMFA